MRPLHAFLAVAVAVIWGVNFVVIEIGLEHFPPLLFAALRFTLVALPAVFLVPRPAIPARWIVAVGLFLGAGQFGLLFTAMHLGLPAGLSSLVLQAQVIFTVCFAAMALGERPGRRQLLGIAVASAGIVVIAFGRGAHVPLPPLLLALGAAACWGVANVCIRRAKAPAGPGLLVWSSLVPPLPLLALSGLIEGPDRIRTAFTTFHLGSLAALAYVVVLSTFVGFGAWNGLLRRYPTATVAPFTLLVPIVGMATARVWLGEQLSTGELLGGAVVLAGLATLAVRTRQKPADPPPPLAEPRSPLTGPRPAPAGPLRPLTDRARP
ncbi:EamA family transporter [Sphaerisporangium perillae]|uniref:EamA family transporter n=1 Tax=Sphaerisporangium perillae TaxID=2935860 RepID=UPI00200E9E5C|nr:EamA family transporter [Sphaerisporangium perillae]